MCSRLLQMSEMRKAYFERQRENKVLRKMWTGGEMGMTQEEFMTHIITEICDYAIENDMEPDDTLSTVADNLKVILEISTFNGWKRRDRDA